MSAQQAGVQGQRLAEEVGNERHANGQENGARQKAPVKSYTVVYDGMWAEAVDHVRRSSFSKLRQEVCKNMADTAKKHDETPEDRVLRWYAEIYEGHLTHDPLTRPHLGIRFPIVRLTHDEYPAEYREPSCAEGKTHDWQYDDEFGMRRVCSQCGHAREKEELAMDSTHHEDPHRIECYKYEAPRYYVEWTDQAVEPMQLQADNLKDAIEEAHGEASTGYEDTEETVWVDYVIYAYHPVKGKDMTDGAVDVYSGRRTIEPVGPDCPSADGHDWTSAVEIEGGLDENPGVQGHGGGVIITEHCSRVGCAARRVTDTWAQDRETGEQGLREVSYGEIGDVDRKDAFHKGELDDYDREARRQADREYADDEYEHGSEIYVS